MDSIILIVNHIKMDRNLFVSSLQFLVPFWFLQVKRPCYPSWSMVSHLMKCLFNAISKTCHTKLKRDCWLILISSFFSHLFFWTSWTTIHETNQINQPNNSLEVDFSCFRWFSFSFGPAQTSLKVPIFIKSIESIVWHITARKSFFFTTNVTRFQFELIFIRITYFLKWNCTVL